MSTSRASHTVFHLQKGLGLAWCSTSQPAGDAWAKGFAFREGSLLDAKALATLFAQTATAVRGGELRQCLESLVCALNGSFAVVVRTEEKLFATVDRLRSIPLFYGERGGTFFVSDDAFWTKEQVGDSVPDALSVKEFALTGYVTGADSLFPNIKQLQAGECLCWTADEDGPRLFTHRYYRWIHGNYHDGTQEELLAEMDRMLVRVFERLLASTGGRTIVLPLSGGLDSRLIAAMLKRLGREDVICFSYGRPGNRESVVSQRVAELLHYRWFFVSYSRRLWGTWYTSPEWGCYSQYASGLSSLPLLQDWPAVWMLRERGEIPDHSVIVPGHTAMLAIQANKVDSLMRDRGLVGFDLLTTALWESHYSLRERDQGSLWALFGSKLLSALAGLPLDSSEEVVSALDFWAWQERQAKFIVNSVRVYEFWGYDWRVPLWDNEMMAHWARVPLNMRVGKRLYNRYAAQVCEAVGLGPVAPAEVSSLGRSRLSAAVQMARGTPLWPTLRVAQSAACSVARYWTHPMAWYGIMPFASYLKRALSPDGLRADSFGINTLLVEPELARLGIDG